MIRVLVLPEGGDPKSSEGLEAANAAVERWRSGGDRVWLDVEAPGDPELELLRDRLAFDALSIDDATLPEHPPKVEEVGVLGDRAAYLLVIARAPLPKETTNFESVALFVRSRMLVTVHVVASPAVEGARARVVRDPARTMGRGIEFAAHAVLDELVAGYDPLLDDVDKQVDALEEQIVGDGKGDGFERILALRRRVAAAARESRPMRDVALSLAREGHPLVKPAARIVFRDLYDCLLRAHDMLESHADTIASIRDAYLAIANNKMNEVMKVLTVVAVISGTLSVVTGLFGMNVGGVPGEKSPAAFWISLAGMLVLSLVMVALFRWKRWV